MSGQRGWSILEALVALAVIAAILTSFGVWSLGAHVPFARFYADGVRAARLHALATSKQVSLQARPCDGVEALGGHVNEDARVVGFPSRGLLFTPDGLPRTCDGGGVGNTTILLEHRGRRAAVIVSALGRVRWELR